MEIKELSKEEIFSRSKELIDEYDQLSIIYLRVSTRSEGQEEGDQLPDIINTYELDINRCLIVVAKESAYQEKKDKYRIFNLITELIEKYKNYDKVLYVWDLDRIYRNQEKQAYFISYFAHKNNCMVLSYRQKFFHKFKEMGGIGRALYNFMIELFGFFAEDESKKKGDRLKKSLTYDDKIKRYHTNKGNQFGNKLLKKTINKGKDNEKKIYYTPEYVVKIEQNIVRLRLNNISYKKIVTMFASKGIKISEGYITNVIKRNANEL